MVSISVNIHARSHKGAAAGTALPRPDDHSQPAVFQIATEPEKLGTQKAQRAQKRRSSFVPFVLFVFLIFLVPSLNYFAIVSVALCVSPTRFARPHSQSPVPNHMRQLSRSSSKAPVGRGMSTMLCELDT